MRRNIDKARPTSTPYLIFVLGPQAICCIDLRLPSVVRCSSEHQRKVSHWREIANIDRAMSAFSGPTSARDWSVIAIRHGHDPLHEKQSEATEPAPIAIKFVSHGLRMLSERREPDHRDCPCSVWGHKYINLFFYDGEIHSHPHIFASAAPEYQGQINPCIYLRD